MEFNASGFKQEGVSQTGFQTPEMFSQGGFHDQDGNLIDMPVPPAFQQPPAKEQKPAPPRPRKRIIICCDGTWQSSAHGAQIIPSNVAKMSRSIDSWYIDDNGLMAPQLVYYDAGVGTAMGKLESIWTGTTGGGLDENVCEAYNFLVNNYSKGDELFFFGFSRGAYTVRACAGLVCRVGICQPSAMGQFWEMYAVYKSIGAKDPMENTAWYKEWAKTSDPKQDTYNVRVKGEDWKFTKGAGKNWLDQAEKEITIKIVGVWDTVGSLGYPDNVWTDVTERNKPYGFHNTEIHPQIKNAFHALALDEHRKAFRPTLWSLPPNSSTNLIQCWFPGVHINIGGGSGDGKKDMEHSISNEDGPTKARTDGRTFNQLSKAEQDEERSRGDLEIMSITTFFWMVDRCTPFLRFKVDHSITRDYRNALNTILERAPDEHSTLEDKTRKLYGGWGIAPILDSYKGVMAAAGSETRTPGHYFVDNEHSKDHEHPHKITHEYIHPVVEHAHKRIDYKPEALHGFERKPLGPGKGYHWVKTYKPAEPSVFKRGWSYITGAVVQSATEEDIVSIPEFVIPEQGWNEDGLYWWPYERELIVMAQNRSVTGGFVPLEEQLDMKHREVDEEGASFLRELDEDNRDHDDLRGWKKQKVTSSNPSYAPTWFS